MQSVVLFKRAIRMRESLSNFWTSWFIFIAKAKLLKFSYVFHFFSCSKMQRGGCSLTSTLKLISKLLKGFSTRISWVATRRWSKRASQRSIQTPSSKPTLLFHKLKQISSKEGILKLSFQQLSQKLHLRRENLPYNRNANKTCESCLLSHNITNQCLT